MNDESRCTRSGQVMVGGSGASSSQRAGVRRGSVKAAAFCRFRRRVHSSFSMPATVSGWARSEAAYFLNIEYTSPAPPALARAGAAAAALRGGSGGEPAYSSMRVRWRLCASRSHREWISSAHSRVGAGSATHSAVPCKAATSGPSQAGLDVMSAMPTVRSTSPRHASTHSTSRGETVASPTATASEAAAALSVTPQSACPLKASTADGVDRYARTSTLVAPAARRRSSGLASAGARCVMLVHTESGTIEQRSVASRPRTHATSTEKTAAATPGGPDLHSSRTSSRPASEPRVRASRTARCDPAWPGAPISGCARMWRSPRYVTASSLEAPFWWFSLRRFVPGVDRRLAAAKNFSTIGPHSASTTSRHSVRAPSRTVARRIGSSGAPPPPSSVKRARRVGISSAMRSWLSRWSSEMVLSALTATRRTSFRRRTRFPADPPLAPVSDREGSMAAASTKISIRPRFSQTCWKRPLTGYLSERGE